MAGHEEAVEDVKVMSGPGSSTSQATTSSMGENVAALPGEHKLIVGVDFGTTHTGVALAYSGTPEEVDVIKTWPGANGITSDKVPTDIAYVAKDQTGPASDSNILDADAATIKWGFQFRPEESRIRCIKLFLDRNQKLPHFVSPLETAAQLRKCNRTVIMAVADYLSMIQKQSIDTLVRRYGKTFVETTMVDCVLTVPAVWSDAAKNATLQAAEMAGLGKRNDLRLISEPEAAAIYTLSTMQQNRLRVGDNFIVCDAGGGTVDLIAYSVTHNDPLRIEESAVGTGGLCGSAFLNYRFEDHVKQRLGAQRFENMKEQKPKTWMMGLRYFEQEFVKRNFNETEQHEINVPLPGLADDAEAGLDSGFLVMSQDEVKSIFSPIIDDVISLIEGQVEALRAKAAHVAGIILVGGFGQSSYLYERLKEHFNAVPPPMYSERPTHAVVDSQQQNFEILQPLHAWTAVVRGAVLRGMEASVVEKRRSRWHYGTSYATVWDSSKHAVDERYWSPLWERWMVADRMQWHLKKGTSVSADVPIKFHYTRNFRPGQSLIVEDELIGCEQDEAPDANDASLMKICTLKTDLNAVPRALFTRLTTSKGVEFDNLDFELHMRVQSARLIFELVVDDRRYGEVQAEFE